MSLPGASGKDLNPNPDPNPTPPDGALDGSDPLLQSGVFIDASTMEESQEVGKAQSNGTADGSAGRAKAKGSDPMSMDWLPAGWRVEYKVRSSGATAGSTDRYYYDPVSGRRFRSKKEVLHFLETGTPKKNANSDKNTVESSASKRQRKSSTKPSPAVNFDFFDVPAKVEWVLTDSSQWTWTPFIGDQKRNKQLPILQLQCNRQTWSENNELGLNVELGKTSPTRPDPTCVGWMMDLFFSKFFIGGNWKCNGTTSEVKKIVTILNEDEVPSEDVVEVVVSPPFVFLAYVKSLLPSDFHVAAQNCWVQRGGAFTGAITAEMLVNLGIPWVIIGHSERRLILNESNEFVGDKVGYALSQGLKLIHPSSVPDKVSSWENIVLAYEPVWAIGTGKVATPAQAQETEFADDPSPSQLCLTYGIRDLVHFELRKWLQDNVDAEVAASTRIIYGGSVNGANCKELARQPDVDGFWLAELPLSRSSLTLSSLLQ
ncbi:hypothetical protein ACLB2K_031193 [Fragaria x ananassa]